MLNLSDTAEQSADLFASYPKPEAGRHDEMFGADGAARPHWQGLLDWLGRAGDRGYRQGADELQRLRTESGIAFAADQPARTSIGDALPVILSAEDWAELERGIVQRVQLAETVLSDIYGPARVVSSGLIPPGLIYGTPAFAAHCARWERPPARWLYVYEADVARRADGEWVVLADRLDTPVGDGWLLANRIATTQAFAVPFVHMGARRLASHYAAFQTLLDRMMGWEGRLVLLTGGESDPRYFSHAYFARYLNASLIEPADVTVRGGAAYVKTLDGLKRIDMILRGVPDAQIDALHRPGRAAIGAPALSLAARAGTVTVANAIGSSAFGNRALAPFAHRLSQHLLGEDLVLADAPCLWLGTDSAREQVLEEPESWTIQPLTGEAGRPGGWNDKDDKGEPLESRLSRVGERLCGTAMPTLGTTPVYNAGRILPQEWMMRVFACRTVDGWSVAPGGVASVVENGRSPTLSFGKDVWVLPPVGAARTETRVPAPGAHLSSGHLRRTGRDLLSRVADQLFWLGRNAERAETTLRILGICLERWLGGNRIDADPAVLCTLTEIHARPNTKLQGQERFSDAVDRLIRSADEPWGLPSTLRALRACAIRGRAAISGESWRFIDRLCANPRWRIDVNLNQAAMLSRLIEESLEALAAFAGSAQENLTRNYAWRFLELGRRIERGYHTAGVAMRLAGEIRDTEETYLRAWLAIGDSSSAYRTRYMMTPRAEAVLDLLILDETNPRALAFQLSRLEHVLSEMPTEVPYRRAEHRRALALLTEIRLADADALAIPEGTERPALIALGERSRSELESISNLIATAFFAHAESPEAVVFQARHGSGETSS